MIDRTEEDIMRKWQISKIENPLLSVKCITYNHEDYIADALDSFLSQDTDFPFEVIVHDDASLDNTAKIIKKYEKKYPHIIKPIYETENQYSKRDGSLSKIINSKIKGKYIAYCEGDDYWIDTLKLQKQVDYLEKHPECTLCIHNAKTVNIDGQTIGTISPVKKSSIIDCDTVIANGGGYCATNSIITRASIIISRPRPSYFKIANYDYVLQMYLASEGTTYCFAEEMSAYRTGVPNSWTTKRLKEKDKKKLVNNLEQRIAVRQAFDKSTKYKYHKTIKQICIRLKFEVALITNNFKSLNKKELQYFFSCTTKYEIFRIIVRAKCPRIYNQLINIVRKIKSQKYRGIKIVRSKK